jgi:transcriptional regulator
MPSASRTEVTSGKVYICQLLKAYYRELVMALSTGYLTSKQLQIWNLKNKGLLEANIARRLDVSRQTVHKALNTANTKVSQALQEAARLNKIGVKTVDPAQGILVGFSQEFKAAVMITFSAKNGVQIWYRHEGDCKSCDQLQTCRIMLLAEAEEREVQLPKNHEAMLPSQLAEILFSKITGEQG